MIGALCSLHLYPHSKEIELSLKLCLPFTFKFVKVFLVRLCIYNKREESGLMAQVVSLLPPTAAVLSLHLAVTPCGFHSGQYEVWVGFSWGFSHFLLPQISFHNFSTPISSISFHFISSAPVMVQQAWSAGILAIE